LPDNAGFANYLDRARFEGATGNGVFGTKIQWMHVASLLREARVEGSPSQVLDRLFAGACFINTIRRDRTAQALSWYRAIATGQWHLTARDIPARAPSAPSAEQIRWLEEHIEWQQSEWERHIAERGARCLPVYYEDLRADYAGQVARALGFLGLDTSAAGRLPEPHLLPQADDVTEQWRRALTAEQGGSPCDRAGRVRSGENG
jgi:LPS sulfotransferase NodH